MNPLSLLLDAMALVGGVGIAITALGSFAFWLFRLFGEKWLQNKFNERLEAFRHAHQIELENLRFQINAMMDRTTKLYQREYEVLPEVWGRLFEANAHIAQLISPFQSYPDVGAMSAGRLVEFLDGGPLSETQKADITNAAPSDRLNRYIRTIFWHRAKRARDAYSDFLGYLTKNGIFIHPDIKSKFMQLSDLLWEALHEREFVEQHGAVGDPTVTKAHLLGSEGKALMEAIEKDVQARLWNARTLDDTPVGTLA